MTRGHIAAITPEGNILTSLEFDFEMLYEGYGKEIYYELECVETVDEFCKFVERFNDENFGYDEELFYETPTTFLDMNYFKCFTNYVYIKNLSGKAVIISYEKEKYLKLDCNTTVVFYDGKFIAENSDDFDKQVFIDKLEEIKNNLSYDNIKNYNKIFNLCCDYENEHIGSYLTDKIFEYDFVDEESLEYLIKENSTDLSRLRCFINGTYDADIYRLNGYGNLVNIGKDDFELLIDHLIYDIRNEIIIPEVNNQGACL